MYFVKLNRALQIGKQDDETAEKRKEYRRLCMEVYANQLRNKEFSLILDVEENELVEQRLEVRDREFLSLPRG